MDFLKANLPLILIVVVIFSLTAIYVVDFLNKSKEEKEEEIDRQLHELEKWLRYFVYEAEQYFGSKTGQLKLAYVYNLAVKQFPWIASVMTYEEFDKKYVKGALKWLEDQFNSNPSFKALFE